MIFKLRILNKEYNNLIGNKIIKARLEYRQLLNNKKMIQSFQLLLIIPRNKIIASLRN
jgi:hypothetical protein